MSFSQKMVISGDFIEVYEFSKLINTGYKRVIKNSLNSLFFGQIQIDFNFKNNTLRVDNINRSRRHIRRLINSNKDLNKFLTLTFASNVTDINIANREFKIFIQRLRYYYSDFKYISVIEFQKRGSVHYHLLLNTPFIPVEKISNIWKNGFVKINRISRVDNVGAYVSKYMTKKSSKLLFRKKKFFCSRNLLKPVFLTDFKTIDNIKNMYKLNNIKPRYKTIFFNEFLGDIKYFQYKIKNV